MMNEFEIIEEFFRPLTMGNKGAANLQDDAAVLSIPDGHELVVTSDTLNEGVHFMEGEAPENIARKALRVNLSDLAGMAATPMCYQLNIAFPEMPDKAWLAAFSKALMGDNQEFDIFCSGGDTTSIKADGLSISITAMGTVPKGKAVRRNGAKPDDAIIITGAIGDAALGLKVLQEGLDQKLYKKAVERHRVPQPRVWITDIMREYVNGAADISDGLIADCLHIAKASGLSVEISLDSLEYSDDVQSALNNNHITQEVVSAGGDDYELILAVSQDDVQRVVFELGKHKLNPFVVGCFKDSGSTLKLISNGKYSDHIIKQGWKHF